MPDRVPCRSQPGHHRRADTLDFGESVAILLLGVLHFFASSCARKTVPDALTETVAADNHRAFIHLAKDVQGEALTETFARLNDLIGEIVMPEPDPGDEAAGTRSAHQPPIDPHRPSPARMYDCALGGKHNYAVDRAAVEGIGKVLPEVGAAAWANRGFHQRAAIWMASRGITQLIDLGCGYPTHLNTHQAVHGISPSACVLYADHDPQVVARVQALLTTPGRTSAACADVRDVPALLAAVDRDGLIDLAYPVGVLCTAVMELVPDSDDPWGCLARLMSAMAPGSYLALSHLTGDLLPPAGTAAIVDAYRGALDQICPRSRTEIARFFTGLELVPPYEGGDPQLCRAGLWGVGEPALADDSSRWRWAGIGHRAHAGTGAGSGDVKKKKPADQRLGQSRDSPPAVPVSRELTEGSAWLLRYARSFPGRHDQVREVRAFVRRVLAGQPRADEAVMIASVLAANAVLHSRSGAPGGVLTVHVEVSEGDHVSVAVEDEGGGWDPRAGEVVREHGLDLVHALAGRGCWGIDGDSAGRMVWARLCWPGTGHLADRHAESFFWPTAGRIAASDDVGTAVDTIAERFRCLDGPAGA